MASELSTRARAFSVEALLQDRVDAVPVSPSSSDSNSSVPSPAESPESIVGVDTSSSAGILEIDGITVELCGRDLWQQFYKLGTEMIITKAGRRMFPSLKIRVSGLDPDSFYNLWLDIVPLDDKRYRYVYHSSQWMVAGSGDPPPSHNIYVQQESPAPGRSWMGQGAIAFDRLKLTNNRRPLIRGQVSLHSMHKYQPRIHIQKTDNDQGVHLDMEKSITFIFDETSFTTVTAYQNQQITRLKIASNPFAKGFREATKSRESTDESSASTSYKNNDISFRPSLHLVSNKEDHQTSTTLYQHHNHHQLPIDRFSLPYPLNRPSHRLMWLSPTILASKFDSQSTSGVWPTPQIQTSSLPYSSVPWSLNATRLARPVVPWLPFRQNSEWPNDETSVRQNVYHLPNL